MTQIIADDAKSTNRLLRGSPYRRSACLPSTLPILAAYCQATSTAPKRLGQRGRLPHVAIGGAFVFPVLNWAR